MRKGIKLMSIEIPEELHFELKTMAMLEYTSMTAIILECIRERVEDFLENYEGGMSKTAMKNLDLIFERRGELLKKDKEGDEK